MCINIKISKCFSRTPGPALISEGRYSGQLFRETILEPLLKQLIGGNSRILVDLDGTIGYGVSFLKNAFGGLVEGKLNADDILKVLKFKSDEEEYLIEDIIKYIKEVKNE